MLVKPVTDLYPMFGESFVANAHKIMRTCSQQPVMPGELLTVIFAAPICLDLQE